MVECGGSWVIDSAARLEAGGLRLEAKKAGAGCRSPLDWARGEPLDPGQDKQWTGSKNNCRMQIANWKMHSGRNKRQR
jgi:hypothetical protein